MSRIFNKIVSMRFEENFLIKLDEYARKKGVSRSEFIRLLVEGYSG